MAAAKRRPAQEQGEPAPSRSKPRKAYVAVDSLSWRPHPLPRGTEVSELLPAEVIEACLADGRVTHDAPEDS